MFLLDEKVIFRVRRHWLYLLFPEVCLVVFSLLLKTKNSDFQAFPSRNYMADALGISTKTIDRGIRELKEKVGLRVERKGLRRNNRYYFPDWDGRESPEMSSSDRHMCQLKSRQQCPIP